MYCLFKILFILFLVYLNNNCIFVKKVMKENWKKINMFDGRYQVSDLGNVKNSKTNKILKPNKINTGYYTVCLCFNNIKKYFLLHRLVYETFVGKIPQGMQINHINENKTDCRLENLNLMSPKENINWGTCIERRTNKRKTKKKRQSA